MGAAGVSVGAIGIAGCSGETNAPGEGEGGGGEGDDGGDDSGGGDGTSKNVESDLPEERMVGDKVHVSNTERYYAKRYQANVLVDRRLREDLGLNIETKPVEITVLVDRESNGEYDMVTYNWTALMADPDSVLVNRFRSDGSLNYTGFESDRYDELATKQREETEQSARQELVKEAQQILGEQRPENQYLYNVNTVAVNTDSIDSDSVVVGDAGLRNAVNYTSMEPASDQGNTVVTNNWDPTDSLNPLNSTTTGPSRNSFPMSLLHDFLIRLDGDLQVEPWGAESVEFVDDTTVVATLRSGMTFHDGESVGVEDVLFTFNTILETAPPAYKVFVNDPLESVEQTGDMEVTFTLSKVNAPFIAVTLGQVPILPKHYWERAIEEAGAADQPWQISFGEDRPIVGSGPFQYGSWDQGSRFEQPAFEDHYRAPKFDMRIQRPLQTRQAELEAIKSGEYDVLDYWFGGGQELQDAVDQADNLEMVEFLGTGRQATWINTENPPFDDVAFRQAVNAITMDAQPVIINEIYDGFGERAVSPINSNLGFWHNEETPAFDGVETAVTLLNDAGYVWDEDGNLYYPEGETGGN
jgi:peptide/nickel transport system substrate-binding protein